MRVAFKCIDGTSNAFMLDNCRLFAAVIDCTVPIEHATAAVSVLLVWDCLVA